MRQSRRCEVGGIAFDCLSIGDILDTLIARKQHGEFSQVALVNPHSVMMAKRDADFSLALAQSTIVVADGVGISIATRFLYGRRIPRIGGPDLMLNICDRGRAYGLRHFFLGGQDGIPQRLASRLCARFPGLVVAGTQSPPFRSQTDEEEGQTCDTVMASQPDILWVGLGAPKQEKWIYRNRARLGGIAAIGVGAAFDFHSSNVPRAPAWVRRCGMEWLDRLLRDPRRMWRRNLDSPLFLLTIAAQKIGARTNHLTIHCDSGDDAAPPAQGK